MNIIAIDFGLRRIGIAVGSSDSGIAFPRDLLLNDAHVFDHLKSTLVQEKIEHILVGMPKKHDQSDGDIVEELRRFSTRLSRESGLPVEFIDERFTSKIANEKLQSAGIKTKQQKNLQDSVAAAVMLQEYLSTARH